MNSLETADQLNASFPQRKLKEKREQTNKRHRQEEQLPTQFGNLGMDPVATQLQCRALKEVTSEMAQMEVSCSEQLGEQPSPGLLLASQPGQGAIGRFIGEGGTFWFIN